jgi:hypothetical protein
VWPNLLRGILACKSCPARALVSVNDYRPCSAGGPWPRGPPSQQSHDSLTLETLGKTRPRGANKRLPSGTHLDRSIAFQAFQSKAPMVPEPPLSHWRISGADQRLPSLRARLTPPNPNAVAAAAPSITVARPPASLIGDW